MDINWPELRAFIADLLLYAVIIWHRIDIIRLERRVSRLERTKCNY